MIGDGEAPRHHTPAPIIAPARTDAGVHSRTVKVDGLDMVYREPGPKDAPVVLLLHGFPTCRRCAAT
ncbi:MAG TPA: hypothetical protein DEB06_11280 [Phycisphaerales bacterium]|nr:hypothetical protein [Phycisphaerales bacterium]